MKWGPFLVAALVSLAGLPAAADKPCEDCWNDKCQDMKGIVPKCKAQKKDPKPKVVEEKPKVDVPCDAGKEKSADTAGHCCWPGQAWNGARCVGVPSSCPSTHVSDPTNETCALPVCADGMQRAQDGLHCCWPGQAWSSSSSQCIGAPQCARGWALEDGRCVSPKEIEERAAAARMSAEEAARRTAEEQAREEAERAARLEAQRLAAELRARAEADARVRLEEEKRKQDEADAQMRAYVDKRNSAALQRNLAVLLGGVSCAVGVVSVGSALGGGITNVEIQSGELDSADDIQATADRGQVFNAVSWGTLVASGLGIAGAIVWHTVSSDPEPPQ